MTDTMADSGRLKFFIKIKIWHKHCINNQQLYNMYN